ncbi:MAG: adenylate/guanylate cyclase domain-containing protein [Spirochaetes bacterium]|nr:adenylate/guanylate cyclase domain-containing protein [Spirochaetota bacterium]
MKPVKAGGNVEAALSLRNRFLFALGSGILFALLLGISGLAQKLDLALYDSAARVGASRSTTLMLSARKDKRPSAGSVELVYVDQYSLTWVEKNLGYSWPWPREIYGIMASFLAGAKAQSYDILFTEASPYGPEDDRRCAEAMDKAGNVVVAEALDPSGRERLAPLPLKRTRYGSVKGLVDRDGVLRRYRPFSESGMGQGSSLGLAALESGGDAPDLASLPKELYLEFRGKSPSFPARNAAEIISAALGGSGGLSPRDFSGKYIFIGFSAPGLLDRQAVPTDQAMPGAEIHATFAADSLDSTLARALSPVAVDLIALIFILAAVAVSVLVGKPAPLAAAAFFFVLAPTGLSWVFLAQGLVAPVGAGLGGGIFAYVTGIVLSYVAEGRKRAFLRRSFSQYLSPTVIDQLVRNPNRLSLGGEERVMTLFFSDVRGFSSISESMSPDRLAEFMNLYLSTITQAILDEGGTVDKYIGDAVVAFWNAPLEQPDHAARAVRAALACGPAIEAAKEAFTALGAGLPFTRIGLHTGKAAVGNMGSPSRFNYTALGDVVNTASRLEEANKVVGGSVLVSSATVEACAGPLDPVGDRAASGRLEFRRLGRVIVDGRKGPVEVWEPRNAGGTFSSVLPWEGEKSCLIKTRPADGVQL